MTINWPLIVSACADCGIGTIGLGEWYMVRPDVWEQAWCGRRKPWHDMPGQEVLCIGCLEKRLGRTLAACDFLVDVQLNDPSRDDISPRLRARLTSTEPQRRRGRPKGSKNKVTVLARARKRKRRRKRKAGSRKNPAIALAEAPTDHAP